MLSAKNAALIFGVTSLLAGGSVAAQSNSPGDSEGWEPFPILPMAWWNDATDVTAGLWVTSGPTRLGRFTIAAARGFGGFQAATIEETLDFFVRVEDPPVFQSAGFRGSLSGWSLDGTVGARIRLARPGGADGSSFETGGTAQWVATRETGYLDPALWDNAGTVEGSVHHLRRLRIDELTAVLRVEAGGGAAYRFRDGPGSTYSTHPFGRATAEGSVRRRFGIFTAGVRLYAGGVIGEDAVPRQRRITLKGADPYQTLGNPLVRTEGAPFVNGDLYYHSPGHANLRGWEADAGGRWAVAANVELEADLFRDVNGPMNRLSLVAFWDGAVVDTVAVRSLFGRGYRTVADAGVGARAWVTIGRLRFPVRVEFPLYVSEPVLADRRGGTDFVEFRWLISLQPIF